MLLEGVLGHDMLAHDVLLVLGSVISEMIWTYEELDVDTCVATTATRAWSGSGSGSLSQR